MKVRTALRLSVFGLAATLFAGVPLAQAPAPPTFSIQTQHRARSVE